jgi:hypothetical protein
MATIDIREGLITIMLEAPGLNLSDIIDHIASIVTGADGIQNAGATGVITLSFVKEEEK